jgi:hypothetical protein
LGVCVFFFFSIYFFPPSTTILSGLGWVAKARRSLAVDQSVTRAHREQFHRSCARSVHFASIFLQTSSPSHPTNSFNSSLNSARISVDESLERRI